MDEFLQKMQDHCGIDKSTAEKVIEFLKEHSGDAIKYIESSGIADRLPGGLGDKLKGLF
jgi:hypothetical protein